MPSNLFNFYSTLFSIEIAVFGIISAVILVFIQLVYSNFSYRHLGQLMRDKYLILFFAFSTIDLLLTSVGSFFLSFGHHNFFPNAYLSTDVTVSNLLYVFVCLLLIFVSISFFGVLIVKNIAYLQPYRVLFLLAKRITYSEIRDFLWNKYGISVPFNMRVIPILKTLKNKKESDKQYEARLKKESKENDAKFKKIHEEAEKLKKKVSNKEDPLLPLSEMAIQFIKRSDLKSLEEVKNFLCNISEEFFKSLPKSEETWKPENNLGIDYIKHLTSILATLLELGEKEQLESVQKIVLESSHCIALKLLEFERYDELDNLCEFWQKVADEKIGKSSSLFQLIMNYYRELGEELLGKMKDTKSPLDSARERELENVIRYIAWLGERLLLKVPIEESPLIRLFDFSTEYDELYNCLLSFSFKYNHEQANRYPLIYFDGLYVILVKLIPIFKARKDSDIGNNIFSICYAFSSFAEAAIHSKNSKGAALAALRIKEAYDELKKANLDEQAGECMNLMVRVGMLAAANSDNLSRVEFMTKAIDEEIMDEIVKSGEDISNEVYESYIKLMGGDHDKRWGFITKLGMRMGTNFGFMFDEATGELYADNDPRRR